MASGQRLLVKITRESLPQVKDKYPFIYLEHGRLEVDYSSVKWIDADKHVVPLQVATLNALLLGPGTTVTHEAISLPHARGGVSGGEGHVLQDRMSSPRTWGCFHGSVPGARP